MPSRYLEHALEAEQLARRASTEAERRVHLDVAALWRELAQKKAERLARKGQLDGSDRSDPEISISLDDAGRRLIVRLAGPVEGADVAMQLSGVFLSQPEVIMLDMVYDLRTFTGSVGANHIAVLVDAYKRGIRDPLAPYRTACVTPDPFFEYWAATMSRQFTGREHRAFARLEDAEAFLAEPLTERPPFRAV